MKRICPAVSFCVLASCAGSDSASPACGSASYINVSVAVSDPTPLRQAQADWEKWSCRDHEYTLETVSFAGGRKMLISVKGGKIVTIKLISGESLHTVGPVSISITSILADLSGCAADDACVYEARFDQKYGIPLSVRFDTPAVADAFSITHVSDFRILA